MKISQNYIYICLGILALYLVYRVTKKADDLTAKNAAVNKPQTRLGLDAPALQVPNMLVYTTRDERGETIEVRQELQTAA
jgi:hypothetical protein